MTAHYVGPVKGKKETATKMEVRRTLTERKTWTDEQGRLRGQSYKELHEQMYGKKPFLEGRNFYEGKS